MGEMQGRCRGGRAHVPPPIINAVAAIVGLLRTSCVLPAPGVGGAWSARERGEAVAGGKGGRASARPKQGWGRPAGPQAVLAHAGAEAEIGRALLGPARHPSPS